ncbi:uncharacterized protein IUM83_08538 [Phytophthora cinnamomi]|uniref:uncharacterized protein n=1 Tax=Phytophthora cinnamomi TaxID=4785 RepID=UPI003559AAA2|nr:hypothetical protein IUM83_08538 [Phytophthora cinnamomi]
MESQVLQNSCVDPTTPNDNEDNSCTSSSGNSTAMTAMEELQELYTADPSTERVSLRGRHLSQEDAEAVFAFLQKYFPRLRHLDLRDNDIHELPQDFGARLPKLVALNLLNNNFRFRMGALRTLGETLQHCPCLKSLSLSLSSPAEEQVLLAMLPRLRILNGTPLPSTRNGSEGNPSSPTIQELQQFCASPAVWKAAEHFARRENDAAVFVALLRNRLDEGFLEIKRKLQLALVELLRAFFSARHPLKQGKAIAALVQSRLDGFLQEEEWRNLLTYLYEPQDSATLKRLVQQKAEKYQAAQAQGKKPLANEKPSLSLPFVDFEQVLYGYQLQGRLELLDGFRRAFEELDTERVGVVNRPRFVTLARRIAPTKPESAVTTLVETIDPFNHDVITFSDAANALLPDIRRASAKANPTSTSQPKPKKKAM